jgi:hypothetical protein
LVCALVAWSVAQLPLFRGMEDWLLDGSFAMRGQRATSARIVLIAIDDASLDELKKPAGVPGASCSDRVKSGYLSIREGNYPVDPGRPGQGSPKRKRGTLFP